MHVCICDTMMRLEGPGRIPGPELLGQIESSKGPSDDRNALFSVTNLTATSRRKKTKKECHGRR